MTLKWERLGVPFTGLCQRRATRRCRISAQLKGRGQFTWQALDEGAQFCLTRKMNLDEALRWADASIQNEERFDNLSTKADILKALNRPDEAKTAWNHALGNRHCTANSIRMVASCRIRSGVPKRWRSSRKSPNDFRREYMEVWLKPALNLQQAILQARKAMPKGQAAAPTEAQKQSIQALITETRGEAGHQQIAPPIVGVGTIVSMGRSQPGLRCCT